MRSCRAATLLVLLSLGSSGASCGGSSESPDPPSTSSASAPDPVESAAAEPDADAASASEPAEPRVELATELHRTRTGPGMGFWALGRVTNTSGAPVDDLRVIVRLLDGEGSVVLERSALVGRALLPEQSAAVAVLVDRPVDHEQLQLSCTARGVAELAEPPVIEVEHEPAIRGDLGGWVVRGQVINRSAAPITGARLELQGIDADARLLGLDWFDLPVLPPSEAVPFEVVELRYDEAPRRIDVDLRPPGD